MSDNSISKIKKNLLHYPSVKLAILFGSLAQGRATSNSDLDLAVLTDPVMDASLKKSIIESLADALGRPVDLIDLSTAGEPLLGQIFTGKRILGDNASYAKLLCRHLIDVADFLPYHERILKERREAWIRS